jgi:hypothetical protein
MFGRVLSVLQMESLTAQLFDCGTSNNTISGNVVKDTSRGSLKTISQHSAVGAE